MTRIPNGGEGESHGVEWVDVEELTELALEYRDAMLAELGVVGVERTSQSTAPGEEIRRYPVETTGAHDGVRDVIGRVLRDVREYNDSEHEVLRDEAVQYATVRLTTGTAAIYSSATTVLGWEHPPTPREVRVAEYLDDVTESDVSPHNPQIPLSEAAETIVEQITPNDPRFDDSDLWVPPEETPVANTTAIRECVTALKHEANSRLHRLRFSEDYDDPLRYRLSTTRGLIVEHYFDNPRDEYDSESWDRVYLGSDAEPADDAEVEALGYVSIPGGGTTSILTIPELQRPEDVLDLPTAEPLAPNDSSGEDGTSDR